MADKKDDQTQLGDIIVEMGDNNQVRDIGHKIYQEVPVSVKLSEAETRDTSDGGRVSTFTLKLSKMVSRLLLQAQGPTVTSMHIMRPAVNGIATINQVDVRRGRGNGFLEESFGQASGAYEIQVTTSDKQVPKIACKLEQ
jgi:hypothetical protein